MIRLSTPQMCDVGIYKILEDVAEKILEITEIRHEIKLCLIKAPYVTMDAKTLDYSQAQFIQYWGYCGINLAIDLDSFRNLEQMSEQQALDYLVESFVHEICHYEQFRDGKRLTERGVEVRSRNILNQILGEP